ncbi:uncharacterized protein [Argopecten irradians]|uniref:uncharacterized protein n=1 Tax=Argopecten irradians TaxID=31199 RepID=UPI0037158F7B
MPPHDTRICDKCANKRMFMIMCAIVVLSTGICLYANSTVTRKTLAMKTLLKGTIQNIQRWRKAFDNLVVEFKDNKTVIPPVPRDQLYISQLNKHFVNATMSTADNVNEITQNASTSTTLLTLFTSWYIKAEKYICHNNTIRNWNSLKPSVKPIIFTNNNIISKEVRKKGWNSLPVHQASFGIPVLKFMYRDVLKVAKSHFYGYSNGDIIFTSTLIHTLTAVVNSTVIPKDRPIMIIGRRTNVLNVTPEEASSEESVSKTARKRGKLFTDYAEDYFITTADYPWGDIPEVVIGRRAYDNWLVLNARKRKHITIDATQTLLAVHQTTKAGNKEGHHSLHAELNHSLLSRLYKSLNYAAGRTSCAEYYTCYNDVMKPIVQKRLKMC